MSHITPTVILALAIVLTSPGAVFAQSHKPITDDQIRTLVEHRLMEKDIIGIQVSVAKQVVTLRGTVPSLWAKDTAIERARETDDVLSVVSELSILRAESDSRIGEDVADRVGRYVFFSIFDDIDVSVEQGVVSLTGKVTMPYKADAFVELASRVKGVQEVKSLIHTLPVSISDDHLRYLIARKIYGEPMFWHLAIQVNPPIHIVVEHGNVTLTGVVNSEVERRVAETIARSTFGVFQVENKLRLERNN